MNKRIPLLLLTILFYTTAHSQNYPQHYFSYPLDSPMVLIGTFGEIRTDHFHSGIDISTKSDEGKNVKAAADGYVSRIKISADGFGKAIYITHPNGYVTVYAHLKKYNEAIDRYVTKSQYQLERFEIELFPGAKDFKVKKGDVIAISGNSGASSGPHLHFEIRDERSEEPINPLLFGMYVPDEKIPVITHVRIFPVAGQGFVRNSDSPISFSTTAEDGYTTIKTSDYLQVFGKVGFEVEVKDFSENTDAATGIYEIRLKVDTSQLYIQRMDRFSFSDTRYVNAHIDYAEKQNTLRTFERCFKLPGDNSKIYPDTNLIGYYDFMEDAPHDIEITARDFNGNTAVFKVTLIASSSLAEGNNYQAPPEESILIMPYKGIAVHKSDVDIVIPTGSIYENMYFTSSSSVNKKYFSAIQHIGDKLYPLHTAMTVGIKPVNLPDMMKEKALIAEIDDSGNLKTYNGNWVDNFFTSKVRHFGNYAITVDTIAPVIKGVSFPDEGEISTPNSIMIKISDDLSGIKSYRAILDNVWLLMEYDAKNKMLTGDMTMVKPERKHSLVLTVTDNCGNESKFSKEFPY